MFVLAADTGCKAGFDGIGALGLKAQTFYVGACAAPTILASVPAAETNGTIVNVEGPISTSDPDIDTVLYSSVIAKYGKGVAAASAGTCVVPLVHEPLRRAPRPRRRSHHPGGDHGSVPKQGRQHPASWATRTPATASS